MADKLTKYERKLVNKGATGARSKAMAQARTGRALGLGAGGCRDTLCNGGLCQMLDSGRCPHILKARPSMEGVGIDVAELINKVGWTMYPIYRTMDPTAVPCGISAGIVFVH